MSFFERDLKNYFQVDENHIVQTILPVFYEKDPVDIYIEFFISDGKFLELFPDIDLGLRNLLTPYINHDATLATTIQNSIHHSDPELYGDAALLVKEGSDYHQAVTQYGYKRMKEFKKKGQNSLLRDYIYKVNKIWLSADVDFNNILRNFYKEDLQSDQTDMAIEDLLNNIRRIYKRITQSIYDGIRANLHLIITIPIGPKERNFFKSKPEIIHRTYKDKPLVELKENELANYLREVMDKSKYISHPKVEMSCPAGYKEADLLKLAKDKQTLNLIAASVVNPVLRTRHGICIPDPIYELGIKSFEKHKRRIKQRIQAVNYNKMKTAMDQIKRNLLN